MGLQPIKWKRNPWAQVDMDTNTQTEEEGKLLECPPNK